MKAGARALGVAESYRREVSTLAGAVVRADRTVDGLAYATCTVGGTDATAGVERLWRRLDRADVQVVLVAGIAPAWYNVLDLHELTDALDRPVLSISFEESEGLGDAIEEAFDGEEADRRRRTYRAQPPRRRVESGGETVFVRSVGMEDDEAAAVVRQYTSEGGRPEPLRVARLAARAGDAFRRGLAGTTPLDMDATGDGSPSSES